MQIYPNHIKVKINDVEYTDKCPFPVTFNQLLDKQLDEFTLELLQIDKPIFKPITTVIITVWNEKYPIEQYPEKALRLRYVITSCKSNEIPAGSGKYNHQLALIEETKYLECFIVRSCGFVNPLRKDYTPIAVVPSLMRISGNWNYEGTIPITKIYSPFKVGEEVVFPRMIESQYPDYVIGDDSLFTGVSGDFAAINPWNGVNAIELIKDNKVIASSPYSQPLSFTFNSSGTYELVYYVNFTNINGVGVNYKYIYYIAIVD